MNPSILDIHLRGDDANLGQTLIRLAQLASRMHQHEFARRMASGAGESSTQAAMSPVSPEDIAEIAEEVQP
ncbi:MAG: hypothetical protein IT440_10400 [Phycisphaeraceae bacterium]|nr:hypothetical protein [Phycisphaeraceae bacterium]